jgi:hypothetical protein
MRDTGIFLTAPPIQIPPIENREKSQKPLKNGRDDDDDG